MSYSIERVKYPDGTVVVRHMHDEGEWMNLRSSKAITDGKRTPQLSTVASLSLRRWHHEAVNAG